MEKAQFEELERNLFNVDTIIGVTADSCEQCDYHLQSGALLIARKYLSKVFEILSNIRTTNHNLDNE